MTSKDQPYSRWRDVVLSLRLFAVDRIGLGGVVVRSRPSEQRDQLCSLLEELLPTGTPFVRLPVRVTEDRLLGGLSLAESLRTGRACFETGLLARAHGGVIVASMAERLEPNVTSHLAAALDRGEISVERDGFSASVPCRIGVLALDESDQGEDRLPIALQDRLAFEVDFLSTSALSPPADESLGYAPPKVRDLVRGEGHFVDDVLLPLARTQLEEARRLLSRVVVDDDVIAALCQLAIELGISSPRALLLATAAARAHAALEGRTRTADEDACVAARLVFAHRATKLPTAGDAPTEPSPQTPESDRDEDEDHDDDPKRDPEDEEGKAASSMEDRVLAAVKSALPPHLLSSFPGRTRGKALDNRSAHVGAGSRGRTQGAIRFSLSGGARPSGTLPTRDLARERLNVVETLRAAAPWQTIRRRENVRRDRAMPRRESAVFVRKQDFRSTRFQSRKETSVIFAVDASGSAALQRLAEAKGAVEQVLADCYVRRDHVALVSFRGTSATLLLPPTRSLTRVQRSLADLAGGGATPLAAGIDAARALAFAESRRGRTPLIVLMTDGRANVARDGREGSVVGNEDATRSARALRETGTRVIFLDTAPRPRAQARQLAEEMGARYLPLPYLDAVGISRHVQAARDENDAKAGGER